MSRIQNESQSRDGVEDYMAMDDNVYREPNSVHISDDWDTLIEDFIDDFEDFQDIDFPTPDDEL